jgi:hypothetical protein
MYQISRALYRSLVDEVTVEDGSGRGDIRRMLLKACEATVHRLATDRFYFAHPARTLFREVRWCFPVVAQARVYRIIDAHLDVLAQRVADDPELVFALTGHRIRCRAWARKGRPCRRRPGRDGYCPSHNHLADDFAGTHEYPLAGAGL